MDGIRELAPSINMCKHLKDLDLGNYYLFSKFSRWQHDRK